MRRCGRPARREVSTPVCVEEKNPALGVDSKLLGVSTIGPYPARSARAAAPHDPPRSADACRSAIGQPSLAVPPSADIGHVHPLPKVNVSLAKQAHDLLCTAPLFHQRTISSPSRGTRILSQDLDQDLGRGSTPTYEALDHAKSTSLRGRQVRTTGIRSNGNESGL
jgi:hypothetical protein